MRLGPSPCILMAMSLMLSTMSVTSSRTPGIEENSCSTPSMGPDSRGPPCGALQRRQQYAPQCVAQRHAEAALERFGDHDGVALGIGARRHLELVRSDQFLPVLLDRHVGTHAFERRGGGPLTPFRRGGIFCDGGLLGSPPDEHIVCHTRRLLRGRQPLWGIGVTSRMEVIVKPADCRDRNADSRPEPGPATSTSRVRMPCSWAFLAASSAATCAA